MVSSVRFQRSLLHVARYIALTKSVRLSRRFSRHLIVVQGAQRSGTTLLYLMLTSHPALVGLDENEADYELPPWLVMMINALLGKKTVYKLPPVIWQVDKIRNLYPSCHSVWVLRHPFAVISSMKTLYFKKEKQSWLQRFGAQELERAERHFPELARISIHDMNEAEIGAHLWVAKHRMIDVYKQVGLKVSSVRYEDLILDSEATAKGIIWELGLDWSPVVLYHHRHHGEGLHPGGTRSEKPIDPSRARPNLRLSDEERSSILGICHKTMADLGYELDL